MDTIFSENGEILVSSIGEFQHFSQDERRHKAQQLKAQGNSAFKQGDRLAAARLYATALQLLVTEDATKQADVAAEDDQFECGQRVAVPVQGGGEAEVEGVIAFDNEDGTYDLVLDDGSDRDGVPRESLRRLGDRSDETAASEDLAKACWLNAAKCAFQSQAFAITCGLASQAIRIDRSNASAFFVRGRARLAIPMLDDAKSDLKQAVLAEPGNVEYRNVLAECVEKIKQRNIANRETAQMLLGYMRSEGVTAAGSNALTDGGSRDEDGPADYGARRQRGEHLEQSQQRGVLLLLLLAVALVFFASRSPPEPYYEL